MNNFSSRTQGLIAINIAALIFGSSALFGKLDISPFWIVDMRAAFAALTLLGVGFLRKELDIPSKSQRLILVITGIILAVHWLTFFASVQTSGVAIATLTFATFPFFTILIETFHLRRKPRIVEITAGVAIIVAVGLIANPQNSDASFFGVGFGLLSALTFAWFGHTSKQLGKTLSPLSISLFQNAVVAGILIPFLFFVAPMPHHMMDWAWLLLLGVVTTALMHQLYFYALRRLSASVCSGFVALEPVYAILFASMLFHESLSSLVYVAGFLIIGASFLLLKYEVVHDL